MKNVQQFSSLILALALVAFIGCNSQQGSNHDNGEKSKASQPADSCCHDHVAGPHGGPLAKWGGGEYHAEFRVNHDTQEATVYILGPDAKRPAAVQADRLLLSIRQPFVQIELKAVPQDGDPKGSSSRYAGKHVVFAKATGFAGTISGLVAGTPYAAEFEAADHAVAHSDGHGTTAPAATADEVALFLKPGGAYTAADINANGGVVPSIKYRGFTASHDIKPKSGDKLCPVTLTKASDQLTWIVGGKTYEFCCPPCLEEFVQMAKQHPEELKDPESFVKK